MALVVESGNGDQFAESYATLAEADQLLVRYPGFEAWLALDDDDKERFLRTATLRLDGTFAGCYPGQRLTAEQALEWPRCETVGEGSGHIIPAGTVPTGVKNAQIFLAKIAFEQPEDETPSRGGRPVKSAKAGPVTVTFDDVAAETLLGDYPEVAMWLGPIIGDASGHVGYVRQGG